MAGKLPRLGSTSIGDDAIEALMGYSLTGVVAVELAGDDTEVLGACRLPGEYVELEPDSGTAGRLWTTNVSFVRPAELGKGCERASHLVSAFAVRPTQGERRYEFSAVLMPLPCPSVKDLAAASRCVGRGQTGPERLAKARSLAETSVERRELSSAAAAAEHLATIATMVALAPDDPEVLAVAKRHPPAFRADCMFAEELAWFHDTQLGRGTWARPDFRESGVAKRISPFLTCFGTIFAQRWSNFCRHPLCGCF